MQLEYKNGNMEIDLHNRGWNPIMFCRNITKEQYNLILENALTNADLTCDGPEDLKLEHLTMALIQMTQDGLIKLNC